MYVSWKEINSYKCFEIHYLFAVKYGFFILKFIEQVDTPNFFFYGTQNIDNIKQYI